MDTSGADFVAGVAGAGTMGRGIAQVLAQCGVKTLLFDAQAGAAAKARDAIAQSLGKLAEKGKFTPSQVTDIVERVHVVPDLEALAPCRVVVEAIVEELGAKRALFSNLENIVAEDCILASN